DGMAPGAQLVFQDINDHGVRNPPTLSGTYGSAAHLLNQAESTGATVHNDSFGGGPCTNCYSGPAVQGDEAMWYRRDIVGVTASGNEGPGSSTLGQGLGHGKSFLCV